MHIMHKIVYCSIFIFVGITTAVSQANSQTVLDFDAHPVGGWPALTLNFPPIALRAGVEGAYFATVDVDSTGRVTNLRIQRISTLYFDIDSTNDFFYGPITEALRSAHWVPAQSNGQFVNSTVRIPILFLATDPSTAPPLIKSAVREPIDDRSRIYDGLPGFFLDSPDHEFSALVCTFSHIKPGGQCRLSILSPGKFTVTKMAHRTLFDSTFRQIDSSRGLTIDQPEWTPDSKFFVFGIYPLGIFFYATDDSRLYDMGDLLGHKPFPKFFLTPPDSVHFREMDNGILSPVLTTISLHTIISKKK